MSNWNTVWHQAMTRSLFQGKAFGSKNTIVFFLRMPPAESFLRIPLIWKNLPEKLYDNLFTVTRRILDKSKM